MSSVETIKVKLNQLRELDTDFKVFGADFHRYKVNEPLTEEQVLRFERRFNIILPSEYREYLLKFGNGGAGPYGGISKLKYDFDPTVEFEEESRLDRPFPFTQRWEEPDDENDETEYPNEGNRWDGYLLIAEVGCGDDCLLVITGANPGMIWYDFLSNEGFIDPSGMTFYEWFEHWLDECLQGKHRIINEY